MSIVPLRFKVGLIKRRYYYKRENTIPNHETKDISVSKWTSLTEEDGERQVKEKYLERLGTSFYSTQKVAQGRGKCCLKREVAHRFAAMI